MKKLSTVIKNIMKNASLKHKFLRIIIISVVVCVAISLSFSFFIFKKYNELLYKSTSHILEMSIMGIEKDLKNIEKISESIMGDSIIQSELPNIKNKELGKIYSKAMVNIYDSLNGYYYNENIISIDIYTENQRINVGRNYLKNNNEVIEEVITKAKKAKGKTIWLASKENDFNIICARDIRQVKNLTLKSMGVLVVCVKLKDIIGNQLQYYEKLNYEPLISIASPDKIFYTDLNLKMEIKKSNDNDTYYTYKIGNQEYFVVEAQKSIFPWKYKMYIPFDSIVGSIKHLKIIIFLVMIGVILLAFYLSVKVVSQIIRHFDVLVHKMEVFKEGDFTIDCKYDYSRRSDELGFLHRSFDEMVDSIRKLVEDNYVKQLLIKDVQIKSLQQQINPHFLFNVLQTVNWMAKANKQTEISVIIEAVGKMLRYALDEKNNVVLLEKEVENVERYIAIQKIRYKERLDVKIDVSQTLYGEKIPKLALQAIVENAIKHSLENMLGTCFIKVYAQETKDSFGVIVEDNGPGIEEDMLEKLENGQANPSGLGIGLMNIHKRIQLLFSNKYGLELYNTGNGSQIIIRLPKK